jgi:signal transduction histidine kinase
VHRRLIFKLLAINLAVIGFVMAVVWVSIDTLAAGYFVTLMEKYNVSPEPAHDMFVSAVHRYLLGSCLGAVALAVLLSFVMLRRVLGPLTRMSVTTREIAAGNFTARVPVETGDEVGQLSVAFNRMAESLEKLEHLRRELMIDVAHELRTPLTNIRGYLEAIHDGVLPASKETISLLEQETLRLVTLVEDVLALARADAARGHLVKTSVDLVAAVNRALEPFAPAFEQKGKTARVAAPQQHPTCQADESKINRILRNLAENAATYTPSGETVDVSIVADKSQVRVNFANPARELTAEDLPFLFERFYRGEKSRSRQHGGAGIGLSIVRELVAAHGGDVGAELVEGRLNVWFALPRA